MVEAGKDREGAERTVLSNMRIDVKVTPGETNGELLVVEHTDYHRGGPPKHVHLHQDEWFYVLEGSYRFVIGDESHELKQGDSILAPKNVPHVFAHVGDGLGRVLIAYQPAGQMAGFFDELAQLDGLPPMEELARLFRVHGMELLGPPLLAH
ncbi:MAG TPA: cupin domain-containing protein [Fimbriimonas sp.]